MRSCPVPDQRTRPARWSTWRACGRTGTARRRRVVSARDAGWSWTRPRGPWSSPTAARIPMSAGAQPIVPRTRLEAPALRAGRGARPMAGRRIACRTPGSTLVIGSRRRLWLHGPGACRPLECVGPHRRAVPVLCHGRARPHRGVSPIPLGVIGSTTDSDSVSPGSSPGAGALQLLFLGQCDRFISCQRCLWVAETSAVLLCLAAVSSPACHWSRPGCCHPFRSPRRGRSGTPRR